MDRPSPDPHPLDRDDDARREAIDERRALSRATRCQCGDDLPGRCPGPQNCPYSDFAVEQEGADLDQAEAQHEASRERFASQVRWLISCDRAAYEARHGSLDDLRDRFRADAEADPF